MTRTPLIAGNWKMVLDHQQGTLLVQKLDWTLKDAKHDYSAVEVAVLPSYTSLRTVQTLIEGDKLSLKLGAQDLSAHESGAYTGEVSGAQLAKLGVRYVAVGHSERRQYHGETDELVNTKTKQALAHGLVPIVCVGEPLDVRKAAQHVEFTVGQVTQALSGLAKEQVAGLVLAYEPVWAIGTGEVATPEDAQEVCAALRAAVAEQFDAETAAATRVLYGGSVKPASIAAIMKQPDVDGALVGGASTDAADFAAIVRFRDHPA
ncbi:triose-phosphate isomerase [Kineococcus rhizosphaerae]|uniref:Triosephosphate isomerase n=1 Tax=Kineococcus rhizosphaerae TaxID=559628 RepID=A0A2T0RA16_9ACTN|nr:triose-phosphate isomerase [Kineococcus rhizosphaerae]PRY18007.1 triosephosphate isomerase [Kineococcus rhizosphaerae]